MQLGNNYQEEEQVEALSEPNRLHQVTPLSKYLAMVLFVILPFVGGYIGYLYAPEKVMEIVQPATDTGSASSPTNEFSFAELQQIFSDQIGSSFVIEPLYTARTDEVQYVKSYIPNSSSCCTVYKFLPMTQQFYDTGFTIDESVGVQASPSGRYIPTVTGGTFIEVYDLETQSRAQSVSEASDEETLTSDTCGYAGNSYNLEWIATSTLQYGVYEMPAEGVVCPDMELLEYRTIEM